MWKLHCKWVFLIATGLLSASGCERQQHASAPPNPDAAQIIAVITSVSDSSDTLTKLSRKYAKEAQPNEAQRKQLFKCSYSIDGPVKIDGNTATAKVKIKQGDQERGSAEWTVIKDGEIWKLKSTPMP
jgi:hypothetical protein